jgi:hypothetical protein
VLVSRHRNQLLQQNLPFADEVRSRALLVMFNLSRIMRSDDTSEFRVGQAVELPHPVIASNDTKGDGGVRAHRLSRHRPPTAEDADAVFLFTRCRVDPDDIVLHDPTISFVTAGFAFPVLPLRDDIVKRPEVFVPSGIHLRICILIVVNSGVPVLCENSPRYCRTHEERSEHKADYNDAYEHREEAQRPCVG